MTLHVPFFCLGKSIGRNFLAHRIILTMDCDQLEKQKLKRPVPFKLSTSLHYCSVTIMSYLPTFSALRMLWVEDYGGTTMCRHHYIETTFALLPHAQTREKMHIYRTLRHHFVVENAVNMHVTRHWVHVSASETCSDASVIDSRRRRRRQLQRCIAEHAPHSLSLARWKNEKTRWKRIKNKHFYRFPHVLEWFFQYKHEVWI